MVSGLDQTTDLPDSDLLDAAREAAGRALSQAKRQGSLSFAYWYLLRLSLASRSTDFNAAIQALGISSQPGMTGSALLARASQYLREEMQQRGWVSPTDEIAMQSFQAAFSEVVTQESQSLFGSTLETAQQALRQYSTKTAIGSLGRLYFSEFTYRLLSRALERELASSAGEGRRFAREGELAQFRERMKSYCWDVSRIVEDYAGGWYSKQAWMEDITPESTRRFVAYALDKLLSEASAQPAEA